MSHLHKMYTKYYASKMQNNTWVSVVITLSYYGPKDSWCIESRDTHF